MSEDSSFNLELFYNCGMSKGSSFNLDFFSSLAPVWPDYRAPGLALGLVSLLDQTYRALMVRRYRSKWSRFAHLVSLGTSLEVEGRMIAQNDTLDEAVHPRAKFFVGLG